MSSKHLMLTGQTVNKFLLAGPPKKNERRYHNKTRSGCATCRTRRVKCDETKPQCLRCQRFGVVCDGYPSSKPEKTDQVQVLTSTADEGSSSLSWAIPSKLIFETDAERMYFMRYQTNVMPKFGGTIQEKFFTSVLLRACHEEPFVADIAMAMGALSLPEAGVENIPGNETVLARNREHSIFALERYQRALKSVRESLARSPNVRTGQSSVLPMSYP